MPELEDTTKTELNQQNYQPSDVFAWANNLVQIKEDLDIELFLFSKNYVVYKTQLSKELNRNLETLMLDNLLEYLLDGVDKGLVIQEFEKGEQDQNTRITN